MKAVSNASPLIYLAKLKVFEHVKKVFSQIVIPEEVREEVFDKGRDLDRSEFPLLENLLEEGFIKVKKSPVGDMGRGNLKNLHPGEISALSLAMKEETDIILLDDLEAVEVAESIGLKPLRTTKILMRLVRDKTVSYDEFRALLKQLVQEGFYMTADVYDEIMNRVREHVEDEK